MDRPWTIYVLKDPRTDEIRYVGVTVQSLKARLSGHICESRKKIKKKTHKLNWIRSLLDHGLEPVIESVETGTGDDAWPDRERFWIAHYRAILPNLTNDCDGGIGSLNHTVTEEQRINMSLSRNGAKRSAEAKARMAAVMQSEEYRMNMSLALRGKAKHTDRSRAAIGANTSKPENLAKIRDGRLRWALSHISQENALAMRSEYLALKGDRLQVPPGTCSLLALKYKVSLVIAKNIFNGTHCLVRSK